MFGNLTLVNAFENADDVLAIAAKGIAEVISVTGQINVDFNDVNTVMKDSGVAIMGSAEAEGENRAIKCVENALNSPLLNDNNIDGAKYVLLNITYGTQAVLMDEISDITDYIQEEAGSTADVIWGHGYDESLGDKLCVTIIATGFNTTPHTGLSMKAPKKNIMNLEDDSPEITNNEPEQLIEPVANSDEESSEEISELNSSESIMKRFVLEDDEVSQENEINNDTEESENSSHFQENIQQSDGKVRFLLEDDEMPNVDTDLKHSETTQVLDSDLATVKDEEKIVDEVKEVESKAISDERLERIRKATDKLRSPLGLNEMESEPAYKRRNVDLKDVKYSDDSSSSRYTLWENINESGEKETGLSDNNSFLHDNVD
jgi:cell division protein FtsZ